MIRQKGLALVLVLWVLSLMTIMAGSFVLSMRREVSIISGITHNAQALAVAQSGIAMAQMMLLNPDQSLRWRADGSIYQIDYTSSEEVATSVRIQIQSESGKIDLNNADQILLQALMSHAPVDAEQQTKIVNAIQDWRDQDDLVRLDGAEKKEYQDAGLSYRPRNQAFQSVEELQLVLGMNEQVFKWIEPLVTIYSGQAQVNLQLAPKDVLLVLPGLNPVSVEEFIAARLESAKNGLPMPAFPLSTGQGATGEQTDTVTVVSEALMDDGTSAMLNVVIKSSDDDRVPFQVLKWQPSTASDTSLFTEAMNQLIVAQYAEPEFDN
ncbi:MAG: general secretion pathway protein GspK [Gammaproteobacteria bacterium]